MDVIIHACLNPGWTWNYAFIIIVTSPGCQWVKTQVPAAHLGNPLYIWHIKRLSWQKGFHNSISWLLVSYNVTNSLTSINWFPPGHNGPRSADDRFRCIFVNENICILIKISLKFLRKGSIDNKPALVEIMAWRQIDDKPLSEPMRIRFTDAYMRH